MSYDPIEKVAKGAAEGLLDWGTDFIKKLATKFRDRKLGFIQDQKTIERVKEQYRSDELAFYKEYIKDKEILFLLKMGLTLRSLEKEKEEDRRKILRGKIFNKYQIKGLHIAQFVENGILSRYIGILIGDISSIEKFKEDIMNVLENIEKHVLFVRTKDTERDIIKQSFSITTANIPMIFIISGIASAAEIVKKCEIKLKELLKDYDLEKISSSQKETLVFKRILKE
ncbi:MAG: hypothetical protein KKC75_05615 [Nanoarchaeota archaeon]|nr:hypothetical protein [Nanoarchaeota archaeon]MBU1004947.1 hypothetical protein [Nanoarchaeota archaeon]MBU1945607.1 hypothetical protein [Nanoarchaeota archaeon]